MVSLWFPSKNPRKVSVKNRHMFLARFILCNTFYLAPAVLGDATPVECMKWAYKPAGEAMLAALLVRDL